MQELRSEIAKQIGCELPADFQFNETFFHWRADGRRDKGPHYWAVGREWEYKGNTHQLVNYGSFVDGQSYQAATYDLKKPTRALKQAHDAALAQINKKAQEGKDQRHRECVQTWEPIYLNAKTPTSHPYLEIKRIQPGRACVDSYNNLLVPIQDIHGKFTGLQRIFPDGQKKYAGGTKTKACFHNVTGDDLAQAKIVYLCEGFATGMTIHAAVGAPVVCAMDCGNLMPVSKALRELNPEIKIILCGDNDRETPGNPGKTKAQEVAKKLSNVIVKFPAFSVGTTSKATDFNDLHFHEGLDKVIEQLTFDKSDFMDVVAMGHEADQFCYYITQTQEFKKIPHGGHTPTAIVSMARESYWAQRFPNAIGEKGRLDFRVLMDELFALQRATGRFSSANVRGQGAWIDNKRPIYNMGEFVLVQGKKVPVQNFSEESSFFYESSAGQTFDPDIQLSQDEKERIIQTFKMLRYKSEQDHIYILGWIICAHICGALEWRPHIWITGPAGSGKSHVLGWLSSLLNGIPIDRSSTEAGLRQAIGHKAIACLIDEAEPNTKVAAKRLEGILELIRQASKRAPARILKGGADGRCQSFMVNSCFALASIQHGLDGVADESRFCLIEMESLKNQGREEFEKLKTLASDFETLGPKLAATCAQNIAEILTRISQAAEAMGIKKTFLEPRQIEQHSAMIGAYSWLSGVPIEECLPPSAASEHVTHDGEDDSLECLHSIMEVEAAPGRTIGMMLDVGHHENELAVYGIKRIDNEHLFVASKNINLKVALEKTPFKNYVALLRRGKTYKREAVLRLNSANKKGVVLCVQLSESIKCEPENGAEVPF